MSESRRIPKPERREDWLDLRRPYIGASEAYAAMTGEYAEELYVRKRTGVDPEPTKEMERGLSLESGVAMMWEKENGIALQPSRFVYQRGPFSASPDFGPVEPDEADWTWGVETKTTKHYINRPFDSWVAQCYVQAYCAGWERVEIAALDATMSLKCFSIDCTTDAFHVAIEELEHAAERFLKAVETGEVPPEIHLREWAVKALFPRSVRTTVELDKEGLAQVQELADARELKRAGEKREQAAKDVLAAILVEADSALYDGIEVLSWRNARDVMRVDWAAFEAEHPDLAAGYRRIIPGARVMRITKEGREAASAMPWADDDDETG